MELLCKCVRFHWRPWTRRCSQAPLQDAKQAAKRQAFWAQEELREAAVRPQLMTSREIKIHEAHAVATRKGHFTYDDPETGRREFTRLRHFLRNACCGSACRHCIYDHVKVAPGKMKSKRFNSSFWVYDEPDADDINDDYMMSLRRPKLRPRSH